MRKDLIKSGVLGPDDFTDCRIPLRHLESPGPAEIHIWYLNLSVLGQSLQQAFDQPADPSPPAKLTLGQLRFARYFYLRLLIGGYLGIPGKSVSINRSERGKPVLDQHVHDSNLHFSIAKSDDRVMIGFSTSGLVGVDLEPSARQAHDALAVARRYFSRRESLALESTDRNRTDEAFLRAWACKEAVVKASGQGIANQLCRFTIEMDPDKRPGILEFEDEDVAEWSLAVVHPEADYLGAVATHHGHLAVRAFRLLPFSGES